MASLTLARSTVPYAIACDDLGVQPVELDEAIDWLLPFDTAGRAAGFRVSGWESSVWVLHAMYENTSFPERLTSKAAQLAEAQATVMGTPLIADGVDISMLWDGVLDEPGLRSRRPVAPSWRRLRWDRFAQRFDMDLHRQAYPPCFQWFNGTWPARVLGPPEGSLDRDQYNALIKALSAFSPYGPQARCTAFHALMTTVAMEGPFAFCGSLGESRTTTTIGLFMVPRATSGPKIEHGWSGPTMTYGRPGSMGHRN